MIRNLWHVQSNWGIFICINPFFVPVNFFQKENFKLKLNIFSGFQLPEVRKSPDFWVWFLVGSQNYGRITNYFGLHIWNILSFCAFFGENSSFLKKNERIPQFLCVYWKHNRRPTFLCWHVQLQAVCIIKQWPSASILWRLKTLLIVTRGVSHCALAIYIKKYLNGKEELWKLKYFTMQKL